MTHFRICYGVVLLSLNPLQGIRADQAPTEKARKNMNDPGIAHLTISANKSEFKSGEEIMLNISLNNSGSKPITIVVRSVWLNHILSVKDESGKEVPETAHAKQAKAGAEAGSRATRQLAPGEELTETIDLAKAFDLRKPGVYTVSTGRHVSPKETLEGAFVLKSNELKIRILP